MWAFFTPHASWRLSITSDMFNTYGVYGLECVSHHMHPGDYPLPQTCLIHVAFTEWSVFQILVDRLLTYSRDLFLVFPFYNNWHGFHSNPEPFEPKSCLLTAVYIAH